MKWDNFTTGRVDGFKCAAGKQQSIFWDGKTPGLGIRVTASGTKSYIFETSLHGKTIRITIGNTKTWTIAEAQAKATAYKSQTDSDIDPRQVKAEHIAAKAQKIANEERQNEIENAKRNLITRTAWEAYLVAPHPKWGEQHRKDHLIAANEGGIQAKIGQRTTKAGPLASLLSLPLNSITASVVHDWFASECSIRPTFAHNAFRKFRTFIGWCTKHPQFQHATHSDCCSTEDVKNILPSNKTKEGDSLQREQLSTWFGAVRNISNPVISVFLQALLITGARRGEIELLQWTDVEFNPKWGSIVIRDKVEGKRTIPLTPYLMHLFNQLPRENEWVFSSPTAESQHITEPRIAHTKALLAAGLPHVSLHGLRRSFGTLSEWVEVPIGVVAQIQGHKPSALAEKHYRRRPLDLLRMWHVKIEAWMLKQAGIKFTAIEIK